jgi:glycosyltransferase involved in cell wall biosynthesis
MKFSLVLATLGRTDEVARFLDALDAQSCREFELIVVDQNPDDRLVPLLAPYMTRYSILHLRSARGLSRARNVGLQHISGDVIAFPDDDCWYPEGLLGQVRDQLSASAQVDGLTGRSIDEHGNESAFRFSTNSAVVSRISVWQEAISYTIFLRRPVVDRIGSFDEDLGVGSGTRFGSGEETDYVVRAIAAGYRIEYRPTLVVHHPHPEAFIDQRVIERAYSYGCGMGRVLSKHHYPLWFKARALIRPLGGGVLSLARLNLPKALMQWRRCAGRMAGMRSLRA